MPSSREDFKQVFNRLIPNAIFSTVNGATTGIARVGSSLVRCFWRDAAPIFPKISRPRASEQQEWDVWVQQATGDNIKQAWRDWWDDLGLDGQRGHMMRLWKGRICKLLGMSEEQVVDHMEELGVEHPYDLLTPEQMRKLMMPANLAKARKKNPRITMKQMQKNQADNLQRGGPCTWVDGETEKACGVIFAPGWRTGDNGAKQCNKHGLRYRRAKAKAA